MEQLVKAAKIIDPAQEVKEVIGRHTVTLAGKSPCGDSLERVAVRMLGHWADPRAQGPLALGPNIGPR